MSYYPRGYGADDDVDDFDEYDPTPYGGGYDQSLTYGRSLSPSDEICYPPSSSSSSSDDYFDHDRPQSTSYAHPSAYADEALDNEYKSYFRPKPHPAYAGTGYVVSHVHESGYGGGSESGYGRKNEYDTAPESGYGGSEYGEDRPSAYEGMNEYDTPPSFGYGGRPQYEAPSSEYGSGYGGTSDYEAPTSEYGSGYGRKSGYDEPSSKYGSGYGRKSVYEAPDSGYVEESEGYVVRTEYERPSYGDDDKPRYADDEGYGRKKYCGDDSDEDEEKKQHHFRHHHRKHYDD